MAESHRINRDRPRQDVERFECDECGESFSTADRLERHRERTKRERLRGSEVGEAILELERRARDPF